MSNIITEIAELIGHDEEKEKNRLLKELISRPVPEIKCTEPDALKTANYLLQYYAALKAREQMTQIHDPFAEQVLLVASRLLVVAAAGFDERSKPMLKFPGPRQVQ